MSTWKPLQMPTTGPPSAANSRTASITGRTGRWRRAEVVAVGEAAGDDDGVDAADGGVAVPQQLGLAAEVRAPPR